MHKKTCVITILLHKKAVSHAINSHVLTGKNPCINQAIHLLSMHGFCTLHIRILGRHKIDVINSNVYINERNLVTLGCFALEQAFFKTYEFFLLLRVIIVAQK